MNTIYLQACLQVGDPAKWHGSLTPRAWFYILDLSDNPDIANYRGYANVEAKVAGRNMSSGRKFKWATQLNTWECKLDFRRRC